MQTGNDHGINSAVQGSQICHCEGASRPWQSREGTADLERLSLKWYVPIASVAAVTAQPLTALPPYGCGVPLAGCERPAGWQYLRHKFIGAMPSSLSFRGAKRRGNLAEPGWITWYSRRKRNCLPEIATSAVGLLAMTHQGSARCTSALTRLNCPVQGAHNPQGARRSLSKKSLRTFFAKLLSELQNQILQHDFAILPLRRVI